MIGFIKDIEYFVKHRRFYVDCEIEEELASTLIEVLIRCKVEDRHIPVDLFISNGTGNVPSVLAIANVMQKMPYEIKGHALGIIGTSGIMLLAACDVRTAGQDTHFFWSGVFLDPEEDSPEGLQRDAQHLNKYETMCIKRLRGWTENRDILKFLDGKKWFNARDAKKAKILNG